MPSANIPMYKKGLKNKNISITAYCHFLLFSEEEHWGNILLIRILLTPHPFIALLHRLHESLNLALSQLLIQILLVFQALAAKRKESIDKPHNVCYSSISHHDIQPYQSLSFNPIPLTSKSSGSPPIAERTLCKVPVANVLQGPVFLDVPWPAPPLAC